MWSYRTIFATALLAAVFLLSSCGSSQLLSNVSISDETLHPTGKGESVTISYTIGEEAQVWVYLDAADGTRYTLRDGDSRSPSADAYVMQFDGTVPTDDPVLQRRLLPAGEYRYTVRAEGANGEQEQQGTLTIDVGEVTPPLIENLQVYPTAISPNADGIDDVASITYQLPVTATVDVSFSGPGCQPSCPFISGKQESPELLRYDWNGKQIDGSLLSDGEYTFTITAQDIYGNLVTQSGAVTIAGSGQPEATITYSYMAPQSLMLGDVLTVTMRVKNTGTVPIRTYGPPSGYEYSTNDVFSSIDGGAFTAKSGGFWRVGMDWDANSGGGAKRYPFRWAISPRPPEEWQVPPLQGDPLSGEDLLMPGEEATIIGRIRIDQQETKMSFYVGLIQDGVGFFQDKTGRTIINVGF